jgi:hypothetical protein
MYLIIPMASSVLTTMITKRVSTMIIVIIAAIQWSSAAAKLK